MLLTIHPNAPGSPNRWLRAGAVILRAAAGLFIHSVVHPGQPACIDRLSGRVSAR